MIRQTTKHYNIISLGSIKSTLCIGFCTQDENADWQGCVNRKCIIHRMTEHETRRPLRELLEMNGKEV